MSHHLQLLSSKSTPKVFDDSEVGKLKGVQVTLRVNDEKPVYRKARTVPFVVRDRYEEAFW
jgi:hypothetical protein